MPPSNNPSRIDILEWRSSLSLPPTHAVPAQGRYPLRQPSQPAADQSTQSSPPSLHLRAPLSNLSAPTSSGSEDTDASGSETESQKAVKSGKKEEADRLVDSTLDLLLSSWPAPTSNCILKRSSDVVGDDTVPLRTFVNEILRRSRSSCATLRAAKWYLERAAVLLSTERQPTLVCARRTFLSSLILANKFMHDRVYSNRAWSRVSGLAVSEVSKGESALGDLLGWSLWVGREQNDVCPQREMAIANSAPPLIPLLDSPPSGVSHIPSSPPSASSPASSVLDSPHSVQPSLPYGLASLLAQAQEKSEVASAEVKEDVEDKTYRSLLLRPLAGPTAAPSNFFSAFKLAPSNLSHSHLSLLAHRPSPGRANSQRVSSFVSSSSCATSILSLRSSASDGDSCEDDRDDDEESLATESSSLETESDVEQLFTTEDTEAGVVNLSLGRIGGGFGTLEGKRRRLSNAGGMTPTPKRQKFIGNDGVSVGLRVMG